MPCYDPRDHSRTAIESELLAKFQHNSPVAEMLCHVLSHIPPEDIATMPEEIQRWWVQHQERDAKKGG